MNVFRKKKTKEAVVTYGIDETGLELLHNATLGYDNNSYFTIDYEAFSRDMAQLDCIGSTMQSKERLDLIIGRLNLMSSVISASTCLVKNEYHEED